MLFVMAVIAAFDAHSQSAEECDMSKFIVVKDTRGFGILLENSGSVDLFVLIKTPKRFADASLQPPNSIASMGLDYIQASKTLWVPVYQEDISKGEVKICAYANNPQTRCRCTYGATISIVGEEPRQNKMLPAPNCSSLLQDIEDLKSEFLKERASSLQPNELSKELDLYISQLSDMDKSLKATCNTPTFESINEKYKKLASEGRRKIDDLSVLVNKRALEANEAPRAQNAESTRIEEARNSQLSELAVAKLSPLNLSHIDEIDEDQQNYSAQILLDRMKNAQQTIGEYKSSIESKVLGTLDNLSKAAKNVLPFDAVDIIIAKFPWTTKVAMRNVKTGNNIAAVNLVENGLGDEGYDEAAARRIEEAYVRDSFKFHKTSYSQSVQISAAQK